MKQIKEVAKNLSAAMKTLGYDMPHGHALDAIAKTLSGVEGWNALVARLKSMPDEQSIKSLIDAAEGVIDSYDDTGCEFCGVVDKNVKERLEGAIERVKSSGKFVVASAAANGFWSNEDGWGDFCDETTVFTEAEKNKFNLPSIGTPDAEWVSLINAENHFDKDENACVHCGSAVVDGYCSDEACWYSDYPQNAASIYADRERLSESAFAQKYASIRRIRDLADEDKFQCVYCGKKHDIEDSVQTSVGLICDGCNSTQGAAIMDATEDWRQEVNSGDTKLGFAELMEHRREDESHDSEMPLHDRRSAAAEKAFQDWVFPFEVGGTSGWDSSTSELGSDWSRPVFLEIPGESSSMRVVFSLSFNGVDAVPLNVSCTDEYGQDCGHGPMRDFTVTLDAGSGDEVDAFAFDIEAQNQDEARVLAKVLYPSCAIISVK